MWAKKKRNNIEEIRKSIQCTNEEVELCCFECLARNMGQQEELYRWIKRQSGIAIAVAVFFCILGTGTIPVAILTGNYDSQKMVYILISFIYFLLVGMAMWVYRILILQIDKYRTIMHEDGQLWMIAGLITKTKGAEKEMITDLYLQMIESEIRKREQMNFSKGNKDKC